MLWTLITFEDKRKVAWRTTRGGKDVLNDYSTRLLSATWFARIVIENEPLVGNGYAYVDEWATYSLSTPGNGDMVSFDGGGVQ